MPLALRSCCVPCSCSLFKFVWRCSAALCAHFHFADAGCGVCFFSTRANLSLNPRWQVSASNMSKTASYNIILTMMHGFMWCSATGRARASCVCLCALHHHSLWLCLCQCCEILRSCCDKKPHCPIGIHGLCMHKLADNTMLILSVVLLCN